MTTHTNCQICAKKVFFTKAGFAQAHGKQELTPSVWILLCQHQTKQ